MQSAGRVINANQTTGYQDYDGNFTTPTHFVTDALKGSIAKNEVSEFFFSKTNIDLIQTGIQNMILNKTCGKRSVGPQSSTDLLIIMRGIYLQDSVNSRVDVRGQIRRLNEQVLAFCVPRIMSELEARDKYLRDISPLPTMMAWGENTATYGSKQLEAKRFM